MKEDKISLFIKNIRKENNLTQKDLADRYGVTYQAVSKWERGINLPDIMLLKEMSKDFNVSLDDLLESDIKKTKSKKKYLLFIIIIFIVIILTIIMINKKSDFNFKTIKSTCDNFNISGSLSYNNLKSVIYISDISYCGNSDLLYQKLECILYEKNNNTKTIITSYNYNQENTLSNFLKKVTFKVDNYQKVCKNYHKDSLYLEIKAYDKLSNITTYEVPLSLNDSCK